MQTKSLAEALVSMRTKTKYCTQCHNISDDVRCSICKNPRRDQSLICVVTDTKDVIAIENTGQFNGLYHILGGVISPVEGIGPGDLHIDSLVHRIGSSAEPVREIILALSSTMEGDTTSFYIQKKLKHTDIKISTIARGIPVGGDLEFADEITLGRSIVSRIFYE